jgi:hypothetical protein
MLGVLLVTLKDLESGREKLLQFRVAGVGNKDGLERIVDSLVIGDFVFSVGFVKRRAFQFFEFGPFRVDRAGKSLDERWAKRFRDDSRESESLQDAFGKSLAPVTGEGEELAEKRPDMYFHLCSQQRAGAEEPGLDCLSRNSEQFRSFRHAHALDQPGHEHFPEP